MKIKYFISIYSIFVFMVSLNNVYAAGDIHHKAIVTLSSLDNRDLPISVSVYISDFTKTYPYRAGWRWGTEQNPRKIINNVEIKVGIKKIFIPLSAFVDLANPHKAIITKTAAGFNLEITGGDAAYSYRALLLFEDNLIRSRKVMHGEFSNEAWEETKYSFTNSLDNP